MMLKTPDTATAGRCPLCGQPNQCAVTLRIDPAQCWCMQAAIAPSVLERVPAAAQGRQCLCPHCAAGQPAQAPDSCA